ncbi:F-box domain-containing protein [Mycena chlorophos]|uniref:F-box domain-containing protein n=1 Tax=Mycena chlorophos TaxID=658473 RepID=A0A8H6S703_MYCCL|nr:F-box domain-containing protein [Mycena chlorophos]
MLFLDITPELLICILLHADAETIRICTQVCNSLRVLVHGSVALRYIMALTAAGVVENPAFSHAPTSERLTALELRESARARMQVSWKQSFSFSFIANMNELLDGFYCAGEAYEMEVYLLPLPIRQNTRPKWENLDLIGTEEAVVGQRIIDINISVKDDLLVAAKYTPSAGHGGGEASLYPYCFSTSSLHPLATGAIKVMDVPPPCLPYVALDVAGDLVVYVVLLHGFDPSYGWPLADDRVFVYNWKTGELKKEISAPPRSYLGRAFLTLDTIVLVNMLTPALEIWDLTSSDSTPSLVLQLPRLQTDFSITEAAARCSHNPHPTTPSSGSLRHDLAFAPDPDAAIIYFTFSIDSPQPEDKRCLLFVHRRSLLRLLEKHRLPVSRSVDERPPTLPYEAWGPPICYWAYSTAFHCSLIAVSGQRCALLDSDGQHIRILDFNVDPWYAYQRSTYSSGKEWRRSPVEQYIADMAHVFAQPVGGQLPFFECTVSCRHSRNYDWVAMDELRILGVLESGQRRFVDILYFGHAVPEP